MDVEEEGPEVCVKFDDSQSSCSPVSKTANFANDDGNNEQITDTEYVAYDIRRKRHLSVRQEILQCFFCVYYNNTTVA